MYGHTRMTALPCACHASASSALKTIWPIAAPGDAGNPVAMTLCLYNVGFSNCRSMKWKLRYIVEQGLEKTQHFVCNERPEHSLLHGILNF